MPSKAMPLFALLASGTAGGIAALAASFLVFGSTQSVVPVVPGNSGNDRLLASIEKVAHTVESLDRRLGALQEHSNSAPSHRGPDRVLASGASMSDLIDRLEHVIALVQEQRGGIDVSRLAAARRQNPVPNLAAVGVLRQLLNDPSQERRHLAQQSWLLLTMEEVVRQLGSPSNVLHNASHPRAVSWEYLVSKSESLTVEFIDNVVVGVDG